ncbi:MAG: hypothetical protein AAFR66_17480 [Bacteroidota bacterium]
MTNLNYLIHPRLHFSQAKFLFSLLLFSGFFFPSGSAQPFLTEVCEAEAYQLNRHAIWLPELENAASSFNVFDENGGKIFRFDDGTALISGRVINSADSSWQWDVHIRLVSERDWTDWSALGRTYKDGAGQVADDNHTDWTYWELDEENSYIAGVPGTFWAFDTLFLKHKPSSLKYGFQYGIGANDKNGELGLSGWFDYSFSSGEDWTLDGKGDVNVNVACEAVDCNLKNLQVSAACQDNETNFGLQVSFEGDQGPYIISDNLGNELSVASGGTFPFNTYPSETLVDIQVRSMLVANCQLDTASVSAICEEPIECTLDSLSAVPVCTSDSTFSLEITFIGEGSNFLISDDKGTTQLQGLASGTYSFGSYPNNEVVSIAVIDLDVSSCNALLIGLTSDCTPEPECSLENVQVTPDCTSDTTFTLSITISGTGTNYSISDDQGTAELSGLSAGTYVYGSYTHDTEVIISVSDPDVADCAVSSAKVSGDCLPPPVCELENLSAEAICTSDSTFEIQITFEGPGDTYIISDNKGTTRLTGLTAGTYSFGSYANGETVAIAITDADNPDCNLIAIGLTEDCAPEIVCDIDNLLAIPSCTDSATTFTISFAFSGSSGSYTVRDDQGISTFTNVPEGAYQLGPYVSGTVVRIEVIDETENSCSATSQLITETCAEPVPENDLCSNAIPISCNDIVAGTTASATDVGVCGFCGAQTEAPGVWYSIFGTGGLISLEVTANFDARLSIYEFGCDTLSCVDGNDNQGGINRSVVSFTSVSGREYLIYVHGAKGQTGTFELKSICVPVTSIQAPIFGEGQTAYVAAIRPNPVRDFFQSKVYVAVEGTVSWVLEDRNGKVVQQGQQDLPEGVHMIDSYLPNLPDGAYVIRYISGGEVISAQKVIILK